MARYTGSQVLICAIDCYLIVECSAGIAHYMTTCLEYLTNFLQIYTPKSLLLSFNISKRGWSKREIYLKIRFYKNIYSIM